MLFTVVKDSVWNKGGGGEVVTLFARSSLAEEKRRRVWSCGSSLYKCCWQWKDLWGSAQGKEDSINFCLKVGIADCIPCLGLAVVHQINDPSNTVSCLPAACFLFLQRTSYWYTYSRCSPSQENNAQASPAGSTLSCQKSPNPSARNSRRTLV